MSVGAGCLAPGKSLLALFVNTAALLWLFVYVLIEVIWNWGLSVDACEAYGWFDLSPSPDHWLLLSFAIVGIVVVSLFFMYNVFVAPPPPPRSAIDAENAKVRRKGEDLHPPLPLHPCPNPYPYTPTPTLTPTPTPTPTPAPHPEQVRRRGKICTYTSLVLAFLGFGGVLLYFTLACPDLATQATEISRLAWLILIIWAAVFGLGLPRVL